MRLDTEKLTALLRNGWRKGQQVSRQLFQHSKAFMQRWSKNGDSGRPRWQRILRFSGVAVASGIVLSVGFCCSVYWGVFGKLPTYSEIHDIRNFTASEVYSQDSILLGKYFIENRSNVDFDELPSHLINALVATEDARFFIHSGVDPRALIRVLFRTVLFGDESGGGGSTISQQLAKNLYPRTYHGILTIPVNKIKEMFVARRLEQTYSKTELLRLYLNTVPFGEDVYGIKVASKRFFGKSPANLKTEEAAVLIGMLKGNSIYHPIWYPERAQNRRNTVLRQMAKYGYLDQSIADSLQHLEMVTNYGPEATQEGSAAYFRASLKSEVQRLLEPFLKPDGSKYRLETDGLRIYTTIDARLQAYAEAAVAENMPILQENFKKDWSKRDLWDKQPLLDQGIKNSKRYQQLKARGKTEEEIQTIFETPVKMRVFNWEGPELVEMSPLDSIKHYLTLLHAGMVAVEPQTGFVKAWVGGLDFSHFQYDHVQAGRQVGSIFKPIVYAEALEQAQYPCDFFENERKSYPEYDNWRPRNSDGRYGGYYSMEGALSRSVNTVTIDLLMETGIEPVRALATSLGIKGEIPEGPAIGLGAVDASLLEMSQVYATFANNGQRPNLQYIDRIETSDGTVLVDFPDPKPETFPQVIGEETNALLLNMLQSVVDSGTARKLRYQYRLYQKNIAGKTGTTQNNSDGWFMGITPKLVVGVWVGADLPGIHFRTLRYGQGSSTALPIFGTFLKNTYADNQYRDLKNSGFSPLVDSLEVILDCPHYQEFLPIAEEFMDAYMDNPGFFERLYSELQGQGQPYNAPIELKRQRKRETQEEYLERMLRYNARKNRNNQPEDNQREELKRYWSERLFKNNKKDNQENN